MGARLPTADWGAQQTGGTELVYRGHLITGSQKLNTDSVPAAFPRVPELPGVNAALRETSARQSPSPGRFSICKIGQEGV